MVRIDSYMDRRCFSTIQFTEFAENAVQSLLYPRFPGQDGEMIRTDAAAVLITECTGKHPCEGLKHIVALRKSVSCIEEFHPAEINIQKDRLAALLLYVPFFNFSPFKEAGHIRQTGQEVIRPGFFHARHMERAVHDTLQL